MKSPGKIMLMADLFLLHTTWLNELMFNDPVAFATAAPTIISFGDAKGEKLSVASLSKVPIPQSRNTL